MLLQFLIVLLVMANALSIFVVLTMVWRRGGLRKRPALAGLLAAAFLYPFGYGLELSGSTLEWKRYALTLQYLGIGLVPGVVTSLSAGVANATWLKRPWIRVVTFGGGAIAFLAVLTSARHDLFYVGLELVEAGPFLMLDVRGGVLYYAFQALVAASVLTANVVLVRAWRRSGPADKGRLFTLMVVSLVPWFANVIYLVDLIPWRLDGPPFFLLPVALVFAWSVRTQGLADLRPIARDEVVERMREAVVVLDTEGRVVDANPAGRSLLLRLASDLDEADDATMRYPDLAPWLVEAPTERVGGGRSDAGSHLLVDGRNLRVGELELHGRTGRSRGRVLVFHDVTRYERQQRDLEQLAMTDDLTGLPNRRGFYDRAERWLASEGDQTPSAWLLIDLDRFKPVNDHHGHETGDRVLRAIARAMLLHVRTGDVLARLGGEEFVALLPGATSGQAAVVAERLRRAAEDVTTPTEDGPIQVTVSIGMYLAPPGARQVEPLLAKADEAMYRAKRAGRNRVETAS